MSFLKDMAAFMLARKKFWLRSGAGADDHFRRADRADQGLRGRAVHLHAVLILMIVLGISAFYHDSAAAIVRDGEIVAAAQEERFTRKKHDANFPANALRYCVQEAGVAWSRYRFRHLLRKAVSEIRAAAGNLSGVRAEGLRLVPHGDAALAEGEAVPEVAAGRAAARRGARRRLGARSCASPSITRAMRRARSIPRRSTKPRSSPWTASANGRRPAWASARAISSR